MDPPPQAHTGVGHAPEYTMTVRAGQLTVTMRTHGDRGHVTPVPGCQREPADAPASACAFAGPPTVACAAV